MGEPIAYLDAEWVSFSDAKLSVADLGIVQAATVTEMIRTFGHEPFRVAQHLDRLRGSLRLTGIAVPDLLQSLPEIIEHIARTNATLIPNAHDLGIVVMVTAGLQPMYAGRASHVGPTVCVHTFPLPFSSWADQYTRGVHLVVPAVRAMPHDVIDPRIKSRSRLHWFMADQEARRTDPTAMALLADEHGHLTETNSGNLILFDGETLLTPTEDRVLNGISQEVVFQLAEARGIERQQRDLKLSDAAAATEVFVSSTTYCLLPVTRINERPIGDGMVGPLYHQLINDWSARVGTDIVNQL